MAHSSPAGGSVRRGKALIAGWFSFEYGSATAGDVLAAEVVHGWLDDLGFACDVASVPPFEGDVDWRHVDPNDYTHVVFVCGPFNPDVYETEFLARFADCRLIGINLTLPVPPSQWNPFDLLIERDSPAGARPDIAILSQRPLVPLIGVILVEDYEGSQVRVAEANAAVDRLLNATTGVRVPIDTRLDANENGLRTQAEVESAIARLDAVVTTRLHGTVLALKNGVPPLVIDPEAGGAKLRRQAERLGWPVCFNVDAMTDGALRDSLAYCLTADARARARDCAEAARRDAEREIRAAFTAALAQPSALEQAFAARRARGSNPGAAYPAGPDAPAQGKRLAASGTLATTFERVVDGARTLRGHALAALPTRMARRPRVGRVRFGDLRRTEPISREFGYDRGLPVDRHYLEGFLERHAADIRGRVLEVGGNEYTRRFGGAAVTRSDVLHVDENNTAATIIGDLAAAPHIPESSFDCIILTQTLQLIFDLHAAVDTLHRILVPGGILLATVPGITQNDNDEWAQQWYWSFTDLSVRRLFEARFPCNHVETESWGNVLTSTAFLHGLAVEELDPPELGIRDPQYPLLITLRARKAQ